MTIEVSTSTIVLAADAACHVVVPGIPSYLDDDDDEEETG